MSYDASFRGTLIPRNEESEEKIEEALKMFEECYENKDTDALTYEVYGNERYHKEDYNDLANTFDGQIDFLGEDGARWSLFLKDGEVKETTPFEILPTPEETAEQAIGRYIAENGLNVRWVLEGMPDFIAGKIWYTEDVVNKMDEMGIDEETQKAILPEAVNLLNKKQLDECNDGEWDAIEAGIKKALKELGKEAD